VSVDLTKDATTDEGIWRECAERLRISIAAEADNRTAGLNALEFVWGNQWDADISNSRKTEGRPALTINHTNTFVSRLKNTLRQQRPRIKCHPVGDGADIDTAATVNGLIRHIETLSDASVAYDTGVGSAVDIGWGYWRIISDYIDEKSFDQELLIKPVRNAFTVYMDPAAKHPAGIDQDWCIISETMKRSEYARKYPKAENCEWRYSDAPGDMTTDWESKEEIRLAEYFRIHEVRDTLCLMSDGSHKLKSELEDPRLLQAVGLTIALDEMGDPIIRPTTKCVVQWFRLNGKTIVERKTLPGHYIPVIRCEGNVSDVNGKVRRKGMIQDMMDPARIFNYVETQKTERYALTPKAPWVAAEGQLEGHPEWNDANQKSYSTLIYKPIAGPDGQSMIPPPMRTPPAAVEAGMAEWSSSAERNLMAVAGMAPENPEIQARVVGGNKYLQRRQGMQDLTHYQYYDNQMLAIACTGTIILDLIPYYYDTERMQRIIGDDGVPQVVGINQKQEPNEETGVSRVKNDMTVGRYDIVMDTGPGYATKREEAAESMIELMGTPLGEVIVKTGPDIVLRNMDFHGADELADRAMVTNPEALGKAVEGLPKQAQIIIGSLQQQLQQSQEQIKEMALELSYGRSIAQLKDDGATKREGMKAAVSIHKTELQVGADDANSERDFSGWMHDTDVNRQTALDVAEIRAASQLLNTHTEAAHQQRAADKLIQAGTEDRRPDGAA
jgi:hypothetical protein